MKIIFDRNLYIFFYVLKVLAIFRRKLFFNIQKLFLFLFYFIFISHFYWEITSCSIVFLHFQFCENSGFHPSFSFDMDKMAGNLEL